MEKLQDAAKKGGKDGMLDLADMYYRNGFQKYDLKKLILIQFVIILNRKRKELRNFVNRLIGTSDRDQEARFKTMPFM